jgi:hypothetical protein
MPKYTVYQLANIEMVDMGENKEQRQVPHVNIQKRGKKHKNGLSDLEIARNF